ncbi:MAG: helix-hairpin-helix domain-containing protein [Clostridia bacterium]|nr:helix-hairpin-helix domain-containing protein [Clostridia bacterium]
MTKKKIIVMVVTTLLMISAILYQLLYKNYKKNEIIKEIDKIDGNIDVQPIPEIVTTTVFVDVAGEVNSPGLYELKEGARVNDAILAAGGVTEQADMTMVNLAYILSDELKITIPSKEAKEMTSVGITQKTVLSSAMSASETGEKKININTAGKEELETLKGIGSAMAERIIEYRKSNGAFQTIEDIKNVSGIGEAKYNAMKAQITV